jgi:uncharacterized protein YcfL
MNNMRKIVLLFVAIVSMAMLVSACSSQQECPAYSQVDVETVEDIA